MKHFGGNKPILTSEEIETEVNVDKAPKWTGNMNSIDKAITNL